MAPGACGGDGCFWLEGSEAAHGLVERREAKDAWVHRKLRDPWRRESAAEVAAELERLAQ